jgi:hypothetical protein
MPTLHLGADTMHDAGTDLNAAMQHDGDLLQEGVTSGDRKWPGGEHDGVELGVG